MTASAQTLELFIVLLALAGIGISGVLAARAKRGGSIADFFLAGRAVGWFPLGVTMAVTMLWALWSLCIGMPWAVNSLGWIASGIVGITALVVLGTVYARRYAAIDVATSPSILRARFGKGVGFETAFASILLTLGIRIPFTIFVGTKLLNALWAWDPMSSALLMIVVPGLFVVAGGYRSVIAIQQAGSLAVAVGLLALATTHGLLPVLPGEHILPNNDSSWGLLLPGALIVGFWYACVDQFGVQRALSARSTADMRAGVGIAAVLVLLGIAALAGATGATDPGMSGGGVAAGFVGAAIIAFCMATLAGHFMSVASVATMDIVLVNRKRGDEAAHVLVGRLAATVAIFLSILTASSVSLLGNRSLEWMLQTFAIVVPPLAAVGGIGLLWSKLRGRGASWGLIAGWLAGAGYSAAAGLGTAGMMMGVLVAFVMSTLVFVAVSLGSPGLAAERPAELPAKQLEVGHP